MATLLSLYSMYRNYLSVKFINSITNTYKLVYEKRKVYFTVLTKCISIKQIKILSFWLYKVSILSLLVTI